MNRSRVFDLPHLCLKKIKDPLISYRDVARFCFGVGEIQVKFATEKLACEIQCKTPLSYAISCNFDSI